MEKTYSMKEIVNILKTYQNAPAQTFECVLLFTETLTGISKEELRRMVKTDD